MSGLTKTDLDTLERHDCIDGIGGVYPTDAYQRRSCEKLFALGYLTLVAAAERGPCYRTTDLGRKAMEFSRLDWLGELQKANGPTENPLTGYMEVLAGRFSIVFWDERPSCACGNHPSHGVRVSAGIRAFDRHVAEYAPIYTTDDCRKLIDVLTNVLLPAFEAADASRERSTA